MAQIRFKYANQIDESTVYGYTSQLSTLPVANIQNELLAKVWKPQSKMVVYSGNLNIPFKNTSTTTVLNYAIPSGTYTGSGLASVIESGLNSVGNYSDHHANYNSTTRKFAIYRSGSTGLFSLMFANGTYSATTIALMVGLSRATDYTGAFAYSGTATFGNEHDIIFEFTGTASVTSIIVDGHNFDASSTVRVRLATTASVFRGGWNETASILHTEALTYNSGPMSVDFSATSPKAVQLYTVNRNTSATTIGRFFVGVYSVFQHHGSSPNDLHFRRRTRVEQTKEFIAQGGVTLFDVQPSYFEYTIPVDPLDPYYNSATQGVIEDLILRMGNHNSFYVTFRPDMQNAMTKYGYIASGYAFERLENTPVMELSDLVFKEQK